VFDISSKKEINLDELADRLQTLEITGLEWFKEYKKLPSGQLRVFCMLDEEKTSVGECLTAMGAGDELTVTPADTNE